MKKKISIKTFYLIGIISIGLIGLAIGSTYAMFTASAEINNPISLSSNLTSDNDVIETFDVTIKPYSDVNKTVRVTNSTNNAANYTIWYLDYNDNINFGTTGSNTSGTINAGASISTSIIIRNNTASSITVTIGVSTSLGSIILGNNMKLIPNQSLPGNVVNQNAAAYITNLYKASDKEIVTSNGISYNTVPSKSLMNDRNGGTSSMDNGNIRYYGEAPNNYIYFNCDDYSNQTSNTCELWRIIGVFNGKLKIIRSSSIGALPWDNKDISAGAETDNGQNDWTNSRLMKLLNSGYEEEDVGGSLYYNADGGRCYLNDQTGDDDCDFTDTGLKDDITRNLISEETWNLGGWNNNEIYANVSYAKERGNTVYSGRPTTWVGKVALPYPSDYGYAANLKLCNYTLKDYNDGDCVSSNWMKIGLQEREILPFITPNSNTSDNIWYIYEDGDVIAEMDFALNRYDVYPTVYLKSDVGFSTGDGTSDSPYKLNVDGIDVVIYNVIYNTNGGSGGPSQTTKLSGETLVISNVTPTKANYTFKGWTVQGDSSGKIYHAGDTYVVNNNVTFVAVWEEIPSVTQYTVVLKKSVSSISTITTQTVDAGSAFSYSFSEVVTMGYVYNRVSCTNGQTATSTLSTGLNSKRTVSIASVTSDTECTVYYTKSGSGSGGLVTS